MQFLIVSRHTIHRGLLGRICAHGKRTLDGLGSGIFYQLGDLVAVTWEHMDSHVLVIGLEAILISVPIRRCKSCDGHFVSICSLSTL